MPDRVRQTPDPLNSGDPTISDDAPQMTLSQFLTSAALFEAAVLAVAFVGGWLTGVNPTAALELDGNDLLIGIFATIPMLLLLAICFVVRSKGLRQVREFVRDTIGPYLVDCHWYDIVLLALLAGICEEAFFRGFLFLWLEAWNPALAILISNMLFGLAHAVTPMYAMLASFLGLYLTALIAADPTPNLLIPITAHSLYDLVAFYAIITDYRLHLRRTPPSDD